MTCFLVKRDLSPLWEDFHKYLPIILHRTLLYLPFSQLKGRWRRVGCKIIGNCGNFQFLAFQLSWCTFHIASWIWCTAGHTKVSLLTWRRWFSGLLQNKADCLKGAKQKEKGRQFFEEKLNITGNSPTAQRTTVGKSGKLGTWFTSLFQAKSGNTAEIVRVQGSWEGNAEKFRSTLKIGPKHLDSKRS